MNIARVAVLGIAIVASGGAAFVAKNFVGSGEVKVVKEEVKVQTTQVLVTTREVGLGHRIAAADLSWQDWPNDAISDSYIKKDQQANALEVFAGAIVRTPMIKGEPVADTKIVKPERGGYMSAILPAGKRAVSTKISPESGAGGFILPNDRVDVIVTTKRDSGISSEVLLENIRVLAIDQSLQQEKDKQVAVGRTATLELSTDQVETLQSAQNAGEISLALRSLADTAAEVPSTRRKKGNITVLKFGVASQVSAAR